MSIPAPNDNQLAQVADELLQFAIDREDIKALLAQLPSVTDAQRAKVEFELQLLKIICVGWSLCYLLEGAPHIKPLTEHFWQAVRSFSENLSQTTQLLVGQQIDYFDTLKDRFEVYLAAARQQPDAAEPAAVMGPAFARFCGRAEDVFTVMIGSRLVIATMSAVGTFLEEVKLKRKADNGPLHA